MAPIGELHAALLGRLALCVGAALRLRATGVTSLAPSMIAKHSIPTLS
jgi:hypothetical protein